MHKPQLTTQKPTCLPLTHSNRYIGISRIPKIHVLRNYGLALEVALKITFSHPRVYYKNHYFTPSLTATQRKAPSLKPRTTFRRVSIHAPLQRFKYCLWQSLKQRLYSPVPGVGAGGEAAPLHPSSSVTGKLPNAREFLRLQGEARTAFKKQPGDRNAGARRHGSRRLTALPAVGRGRRGGPAAGAEGS